MQINNLTRFKIDRKKFSTVAKKVLSGENKGIEISLAFITKEEIRKLNKKFRHKNSVTDVLSFEGINEVIVCPEVVNKKKEDIIWVFIHGILHLCGYDHEKSDKEADKMLKKEKFYLNKFYVAR